MAKEKNVSLTPTLIAVLLVVILAASLVADKQPITGESVRLTSPQKAWGGWKVTYNLYIDKATVNTLDNSRIALQVADQITNTVNDAKGLAEDGLISLLGLPSIPDAYEVLTWVTSWLKDNAPSCLQKIGEKYRGKEFNGKFAYEVKKGQGSRWYTDWDYFYATETFTGPGGFSCVQQKGCVFSAKNPGGRGYTGEFGSCFG